jgi:DNA repair protein RecO (recombination protein O)
LKVVERSSVPLIETPAFLLGRVDYGEADLVVHFLTERFGKITSMARGARRSRKRYAGALEPMHTLTVSVLAADRSEFVPLRDATLLVPRPRLTSSLDEMRAAGQALRWIRKAAPPKTPEPGAFDALQAFLDELDVHAGSQDVDAKLAAFGLRMLTSFGWGLELAGCLRCGRPCPPERPALLSPERGGLICLRCGGGPMKISAELLSSMRAVSRSDSPFPHFSDTDKVLEIVDRALAAHLGFSAKD